MMQRDTYSFGRVERDQNWVAGSACMFPSFRGEGVDNLDSDLSEMLFAAREATINTQDYVRSPFPALGAYDFGTPQIPQGILDDIGLTSSIYPFALNNPYDRDMIGSQCSTPSFDSYHLHNYPTALPLTNIGDLLMNSLDPHQLGNTKAKDRRDDQCQLHAT